MPRDPTILGIDILVDRLEQVDYALTTEISGELRQGAQDIANIAKSLAPTDQGFLKNQISSRAISQFEFQVVSGVEYSPYLEFGTLSKVNIPPGLEEYAAQFKGDFSSGTLGAHGLLPAKEAIFAWCARNGIDEELWYPIYVSIMIHGIQPRPFFFPAFNRQEPIIIERVNNVLKDALK